VDADLIIKLMARATVLMGATFYMWLFIAGSAPLLAGTHREWQVRTGQAVLERYGMTETNVNTLYILATASRYPALSAIPCQASRCASPILKPPRNCRERQSA
jgi:acyl-CoA synthetase (AMP-forming)/AMP-acid ligase II